MKKGRLEAFSDGVFSILITIMVLELKMPGGADLKSLESMLPKLVAYAVSFVFIGVYWSNHHHILHITRSVSVAVLWANLHMLFWLSLMPLATAWIGENVGAPAPIAVYSGLQMMCAMGSYFLLQSIASNEGPDWEGMPFTKLTGKIAVTLVLQVVVIGVAFVNVWVAYAIQVAVVLLWVIPDRGIEERVKARSAAVE